MRRYDTAKLSKVTRTDAGGLRIEGTLTRTGIFPYTLPDGSVRREYRPPEEVFNRTTLDSFRGVPVTIGHPGLVTSANYREHAVGHVGDDLRNDARYVRATLHVQDADAVRAIEQDELKELSCGYDVDLDETPGESSGERYDAIQRNIRGNHVAMIPAGTGRAGRDVAMRLDAAGDCILRVGTMADKTTKQAPEGVTVKADTVSLRVDGQVEIDRLKAENEMLKAKVAEQASALADTSRLDTLVSERVDLVDTARAAVKGYDPKGQTNRQIKMAVIQSKRPGLKLDSVSDDYVNAAFDMAIALDTGTPHATLGQVRTDAVAAAPAEDPIAAADKKNRLASREAWKYTNRSMILEGKV